MVKLVEENKMGLPLKGKRIAITRSREQSEELGQQIEELGGEVLELPLINIAPHCEPEVLEEIFSELGGYNWIFFTSVNGVDNFFSFFLNQFKDLRCLGGMRIACIGKATAQEVEKYHLEVDIIPKISTAEALADAVMEEEYLESLKVLVITGNMNKKTLAKKLEDEGKAIVDTLQVYKTLKTDLEKEACAIDFRKNGADAIVFASGSAVESFVEQAKSLQLEKKAKHPVPCSIGPVTTAALKKYGMTNCLEAKTHSLEGVVELLISQVHQD